LFVGLATGCAPGDVGPAPIVQDSAGVQLVRHGPLADYGRLVYPAEYILTIGDMEGPPEMLFAEVAGVELLDDGTVAVLDREAAVRGVTEKLAEPLGMSTERAAASVFDVLLARTVGAIREITVERGLDPREFSLVAFGGAGPMLAPLLARGMELPEVVVPAAPAVFSAWGMLMSDLEYDVGQTVLTMLDDATLAQMQGVLAQLESEADQVLAAQSVPPENRVFMRRLDLRYNGQEHTLSVELEEADDQESVAEKFHEQHLERYGHKLNEEVQILTARVRGVGLLDKPSRHLGDQSSGIDQTASRVGERHAFDFATRERRVFPIYERSLLQPEVEIEGPAIIREPTSVTIVHSDQIAVPDRLGNLVVR